MKTAFMEQNGNHTWLLYIERAVIKLPGWDVTWQAVRREVSNWHHDLNTNSSLANMVWSVMLKGKSGGRAWSVKDVCTIWIFILC